MVENVTAATMHDKIKELIGDSEKINGRSLAKMDAWMGRSPREYSLRQNNPNTFNSSTTIKYELPKSSAVRLSVYNMLGREVAELVNEKKNAGWYEVKFDAARLSSGVYFYRLQTGEFVQSKRLVLLK